MELEKTNYISEYLETATNIDLIIVDLIIPMVDGIDILKIINNKRMNVKTIVLTSFNCPQIITLTSRLGSDYYLLKPVSLKKLESTILIGISLDGILHKLGIPSHLKGYNHIKEAISLFNNKYLIEDIYRIIAISNHTNYRNIESSIRYAIMVGYDRGDIEYIENIFGYSVDSQKMIPSNYLFIKTIAYYYREIYVNIDKKSP